MQAPSVPSSLCAYPLWTLAFFGAVTSYLAIRLIGDGRFGVLVSFLILLANLAMWAALKLLVMLMMRLSRNGGVVTGDWRHVLAIFALMAITVLLAAPLLPPSAGIR
jgi:hypothetical protein